MVRLDLWSSEQQHQHNMRQSYILGSFIKSCAGMRAYGINIIGVLGGQPWYQSHVIAKSQANLLTSTSSIGFHLSNQSANMHRNATI